MTTKTAHHERIDELIESASETMHQMIDQAIRICFSEGGHHDMGR